MQTLKYISGFHSFPHTTIPPLPKRGTCYSASILSHTHRALQRQFDPKYWGSNCSYPCFITSPHKQSTVWKAQAPDNYVKGHKWKTVLFPPQSLLFSCEGHWASLIFPSFINRPKPGVPELTKNMNVCVNVYVCKYKHTHRGCETDAALELKHNIPLPYASRTTLYNMRYYAQKIKRLMSTKMLNSRTHWKHFLPDRIICR